MMPAQDLPGSQTPGQVSCHEQFDYWRLHAFRGDIDLIFMHTFLYITASCYFDKSLIKIL